MFATGEALESVAFGVKAQACVLVGMERAEGFVLLYIHAELRCDLLDGEVF